MKPIDLGSYLFRKPLIGALVQLVEKPDRILDDYMQN